MRRSGECGVVRREGAAGSGRRAVESGGHCYLKSVRIIPMGLVAALLSLACESYTEVPGETPYGATLSGANVKPTAVTTEGQGLFTASLHPHNEALSYTLTWSGLETDVTDAHLHGPALAAAVGPVLVDLEALPAGSEGTFDLATGTATGRLDLTAMVTATVSGDSLLTLLNRGQLYVDVHTVGQAGGEVRGQIARR